MGNVFVMVTEHFGYSKEIVWGEKLFAVYSTDNLTQRIGAYKKRSRAKQECVYLEKINYKDVEAENEWNVYVDAYGICATEFICSNCKESFCSSEPTDEEFLAMMKCCPNCGKPMNRERTE